MPNVPACPEQRSTMLSGGSGISCSVSAVFLPTFCTREWHGIWYDTLPSDCLKSVFNSPSRLREIKYSNGSHIASFTNCVSASSGNINGNSCLYINVQDGIGVRIA